MNSILMEKSGWNNCDQCRYRRRYRGRRRYRRRRYRFRRRIKRIGIAIRTLPWAFASFHGQRMHFHLPTFVFVWFPEALWLLKWGLISLFLLFAFNSFDISWIGSTPLFSPLRICAVPSLRFHFTMKLRNNGRQGTSKFHPLLADFHYIANIRCKKKWLGGTRLALLADFHYSEA